MPTREKVVQQSADWFVPRLIAALERQHGVVHTPTPNSTSVVHGELPEELRVTVDCLRLCGKKSCMLGDESWGSKLFEAADKLERWARSLPEKVADAILGELSKKSVKKNVRPTKMSVRRRPSAKARVK